MVDFIDEAEQKFLASRAERTQESIDKPKEHLAEIRKQADTFYSGIMDRLYTKLLADGLGGDIVVDPNDLKTGIYEDNVPQEQGGNVTYNFVIAWNETLKKYHSLLAVRAAHHAKETKPDSDSDSDESDEPVEG
jgi:hypothetical protein